MAPSTSTIVTIPVADIDDLVLVTEKEEIRALLRAERPAAPVDLAIAAKHAEADDALLQPFLFFGGPTLMALFFHGATAALEGVSFLDRIPETLLI